MKKGILLVIVFLIMLSTVAYAISYGSKITRIQTFPGEKIKEEIEAAKAAIDEENSAAALKLDELQNAVDDLQDNIDKLSADSANARTETNVQLSNVVNAISNLKTQLDDLREVKYLRSELPAMLEQPRAVIPPNILVLLSGFNAFLLLVIIGLILFVKKEHEGSHKTTPHGHPELHEYIKQHIGKGVHINTIRQQLIAHDWDPAEIDEAIRQVRES